MTDDDGELRGRIARIDPARRRMAADLLQSRTAHEIRERAMQTIETAPATTAGPRWRRPALVLGAAASVAAVAVGVVVALGGGDGGTPKRDAPVTTLALNVPAGGPVMSSCVQFDVAILRDMPVAFAGTVTDVTADSVTLDVDRWYQGGTADRVTVTNPTSGMPVSIEGVEFTRGGRYLVAATDGTVNSCGYSGPATAELESAYGEAFGGS